MNQQSASSSTNFYRAMKYDQFKQVVEAITAGKYSWACVLLLWFSGYNPLRYIPYRTYNRLVKENRKDSAESINIPDQIYPEMDDTKAQSMRSKSFSSSTQIRDISYVETMDKKEVSYRGGSLQSFWKGLKLGEQNPGQLLWSKPRA
jgi:hypothetical protein